jgi:hypothetical protein
LDTGEGKGREKRNFSGNKIKATTERNLSSFSLFRDYCLFLVCDLDPRILSMFPFTHSFLFLFTIILKSTVLAVKLPV